MVVKIGEVQTPVMWGNPITEDKYQIVCDFCSKIIASGQIRNIYDLSDALVHHVCNECLEAYTGIKMQ
jgi:hypothetical protein